MPKCLLQILCASSWLLLTACGESTPSGENVPEGYALVWADEFDYVGLPDSTKWSYQTGGHGWTAKELQFFKKADPDNVTVEDGKLKITALVERERRNKFTSTRLVSKQKGEFQYGYIEVRAKPAAGAGLRSAFWLIGANVGQKGWPYAGEIDLFEHFGKYPDLVNSAVQTPDNHWAKKQQLGGSYPLPGAENDFHTYGLHWTEEALVFSVDGNDYWTYVPKEFRGESAYPFNWPFYLIASLSVGGERGPNAPVDRTAFPATMEIDYVRVYQ